MGLRSCNKNSLTVNMYLLWKLQNTSSVCRGKRITDPQVFLSAKLPVAFCCNISPDRKIEAAASDKGQKINIQSNVVFVLFFWEDQIRNQKKNKHVAQMIRAGATFSFCVPPASDRVNVLLQSPLSFNRIVFGDARLEFACKPATYPTRTHETLKTILTNTITLKQR